MFRNQFLLSDQENIELDWQKWEIGKMNLFCHPDLKLTKCVHGGDELFLLGSMYDWVNPDYSNQQIIRELLESVNLEAFFSNLGKYCGQYVLIYRFKERLIILNDACSQSEVYYTTDFSNIATQPKLLATIVELVPHSDKEAKIFYESNAFKKKCLFVGNSTHTENIKHLLPNHYVDVSSKKVGRFFPTISKQELPLEKVADQAIAMLKGYIRAISNRHEISLGVTAGVDSRTLFLSSLSERCKYFVLKFPHMNEEHHDITISKRLTTLLEKDFEVIEQENHKDEVLKQKFLESVDFPLFWNTSKEHNSNRVIINGNVSEVARNYFGYYKKVNSTDLAFLNGYKGETFPIRKYKEWLKVNKPLFESFGYNYLDMFYWEEKMGNWLAKAITESNTMGRNVISPFNSRDLLVLLLSTNRKYRDSHFSKLYDLIFEKLSEGRKELRSIPVNPTRKQLIIKTMKKFRLYNLYRFIGLKTRLF